MTPAKGLVATLIASLLGVVMACSTGSVPESSSECGDAPDGFVSRTADVPGARLHYVIGGQGPAVVLLHGFPETWWTWRDVAPLLADGHTVIAPDLPGVGCSSVDAAGYDAETMAQAIHALVTSLGLPGVALVGHDTGGWVAYAYARQYREQVSHLVLSGAAIPGFGLEELLDFRTPGPGLAHLPFFMQPEVPELLIGGREQEYFTAFVNSEAARESGAVDVYARSYARPGRLTAALGQYRALYVDAQDNRRGAGPKLGMPTMALSGVGHTALSAEGLRRVAVNVTETPVPGAGHYTQEDKPIEVAEALKAFFDGAPPS